MLAKLRTFSLVGIDALPVEVEVDVSPGALPKTVLVGLPEAAVKESIPRVERAIVNSGYLRPQDRVVINLAPAELPKQAASFDLPITLGILAASGQITSELFEQYAVVGELALDGSTRPTRGALSIAISAAKESGLKGLVVPSTSAVRALAFSPTGGLLATATDGGVTQIWDASSGQVSVTLSGHTSLVMDVAFSADGKRLATASRDGTAKLWDPATGQLLLTLQGGGRGLNGVAFSPDGTRLFTSGDDGIRAYVLRIEDLVALAHTRVTRSFTLAECQQYLHLAQCPATVSK